MTSLEPAGPPQPPSPSAAPEGSAPMTLRTPEDLLALVPTVFGFVPNDSLVMLSSRARRMVHARVDLPADRAHHTDLPDVVAALHEPIAPNGVEGVLLAAYTDDHRLGRSTCVAVARALARRGVAVELCLRADGARWFPVDPDDEVAPRGTPYDLSSHPFVARAVLEGRVVLRTRAQMAQSLQPQTALVAEVSEHVTSLRAHASDGSRVRARRARTLVHRHACDDTVPGSAETALLLEDLRDVGARDAAMALMTRDNARRHVRLWTHVVRSAPPGLLAAPATLLAFAAWLSGHGALAWCALERAGEDDPDYPLAGHLARLLQAAVPPDAWDPGHLRTWSA